MVIPRQRNEQDMKKSMKVIDEIALPNGLTLTVTDKSRSIAADTTKVELVFRMNIEVSESLLPSAADLETLVNIFGNQLTYEHILEKTFVNSRDEEIVRNELLDTFKKNSLAYLSSPDFAKKMAMATLRDIKNNPFKYSTLPRMPEEEF